MPPRVSRAHVEIQAGKEGFGRLVSHLTGARFSRKELISNEVRREVLRCFRCIDPLTPCPDERFCHFSAMESIVGTRTYRMDLFSVVGLPNRFPYSGAPSSFCASLLYTAGSCLLALSMNAIFICCFTCAEHYFCRMWQLRQTNMNEHDATYVWNLIHTHSLLQKKTFSLGTRGHYK